MDKHSPSEISLERFRSFLELLARTQLGPHEHAKLDPADLAQETLAEAHRKRDQFRGSTDAELAAWLKRMLAYNLADAYRALGRDKRDVSRERSLDQALSQSYTRLEAYLQAVQTSPSGRVMKDELLLKLADAIKALPLSQRDAVELHHLQGRSLAETADVLERSEASVAGLLRRGLKQLRQLMSGEDLP